LLETIESFDYPVVLCHSPNDELVFYANVPNTTMNDNLVMIQDHGDGVPQPSGNHSTAFGSV
jgi:hypothetical protein